MHDEREEERDWPEDDLANPTHKTEPEQPEIVEPEDDAARLPIRQPPRRRAPGRRRGAYRPPSELDKD